MLIQTIRSRAPAARAAHAPARPVAPLRRVARAGCLIVAAVALGACGDSVSGPDAAVATVVVKAPTQPVRVGDLIQLQAEARNAAGVVLQGKAFTWAGNAPAIATVDLPGGLKGEGVGSVTVTATETGSGVQGSLTIPVGPGPAAKIVITPNPAEVEVGRTIQLTASVRDAKDNVLQRTVSWTARNPGTATVHSSTGLVTGVFEGTAEITAGVEGVMVSHSVTVRPKAVTSVEVTPREAHIYVGQSAVFQATARDADGQVVRRGTFSWVSTPSVLDSNMILSGPERGTAQIFGAQRASISISAELEGRRSNNATLNVLVPTRLTLSTSGAGGGTLRADPQQESYPHDAVVRVTPTADVYSYFTNWGGSCSGSTIPCQVTMNVDRTVTGTFAAQPWMGTWSSSMTAVRHMTDGGSCTWQLTFAPTSAVVVTYPRNASTGVRTVSARVRMRFTAPTGRGTGGWNCGSVNTSLDQTLTGTPEADGGFALEGRLGGVFDVVIRGMLNEARQLPGTITIQYIATASNVASTSGTTTASFTALPTLDPPPSH
jgi:uncharacterized protein YjdB